MQQTRLAQRSTAQDHRSGRTDSQTATPRRIYDRDEVRFISTYRSDDGRVRIDPDGRRTVKIRGQATPPRRRPAIAVQTYGANPDRAAMWAVVMGVFMVVVAIATSTSA